MPLENTGDQTHNVLGLDLCRLMPRTLSSCLWLRDSEQYVLYAGCRLPGKNQILLDRRDDFSNSEQSCPCHAENGCFQRPAPDQSQTRHSQHDAKRQSWMVLVRFINQPSKGQIPCSCHLPLQDGPKCRDTIDRFSINGVGFPCSMQLSTIETYPVANLFSIKWLSA